MRIPLFSVLLLPALVVYARFLGFEKMPDVEGTLMERAVSASSSILDSPAVTSTADLHGVELRQVRPAVTTLSVTTTVPAVPAPAAPPAPVIHALANPAPPAPSKTSCEPADGRVTAVTTSFSNVPFVTVQWAETFIGGTYSTWLPHTVSFDFKPETPDAPVPGKGEIGMGTLTGETGQTQTVFVAEGAAPTHEAGWFQGVAAMVGVGIAGFV